MAESQEQQFAQLFNDQEKQQQKGGGGGGKQKKSKVDTSSEEAMRQLRIDKVGACIAWP